MDKYVENFLEIVKMQKARTVNVNGTNITVITVNEKDYISLTDMVREGDGNDKIQQWIRNKDTIEFLGVWESLYNPEFDVDEYQRIMYEAGVSRFTISIKQWNERTKAIGVIAKKGKSGGTYAHKDIAFEFGTFISPAFKLYLIKEFDRLKETEAKGLNESWNAKRFLSRNNNRIQTDAIKEKVVPYSGLPKQKESIVYASEAEMLNFIVFGMTSKQWKERNPGDDLNGRNIRDYADNHQLVIMSNLLAINADLMRRGYTQQERGSYLKEVAVEQLKSLLRSREIEDRNQKSPNIPRKTLGQSDDEKI